jgi:hypothetical protein
MNQNELCDKQLRGTRGILYENYKKGPKKFCDNKIRRAKGIKNL